MLAGSGANHQAVAMQGGVVGAEQGLWREPTAGTTPGHGIRAGFLEEETSRPRPG